MKLKANRFLSSQLRKFQHQELGEEQTELINNWFDEKKVGESSPQMLMDGASRSELRDQLFKGVMSGIEKHNGRHWYRYSWVRIASVLLVASTLAILLFLQNNNSPQVTAADQIYETRNGEVKKIMLPDGSYIWMNAGTLIRVPKRFTTFRTREVNLEHGEAFFQVKRDTLRPFQIKTVKYLTTVLGTSFNIRCYPGDNSYQVAVVTGKVKVEKTEADGFDLLSPGLVKGEILDFNEQSNHPVIRKGNTQNLMAWTNGQSLYLEDMDLLQIGKALQRHYGIPVKVRLGKTVRQKYTIAFGEPEIKGAVQQLALKTGINYQLTDHSLIIKENR